MSYRYALLDETNIVQQVIIATPDVMQDRPGNWIKGCLDIHNTNQRPDIGCTYLPGLDLFIAPRPGLKWKLGPDYKWVKLGSQQPPAGPAVPGTYELPLKDSNGKQLYTVIINGPNKADVQKIPLIIAGICLDMRTE